jgi:ATP diphosphatase
VSEASRLLEIMARLRDEQGGCPWDLEQDFASIAPYTIEEAYEVDDAIRRGDFAALREELGDLLLQVVFHAQMAREAGLFDFGDVVEAICEKLVDRHPHVFGDAVIATASAQTEAWERRKAEERAKSGAAGVADGVPLSLPALLRARKLLSRAARAGVASPLLSDPEGELARALGSLRAAGDPAARLSAQGAVLLAAAALARQDDLDPERALRDAVARFEAWLREREAAGAPTPTE